MSFIEQAKIPEYKKHLTDFTMGDCAMFETRNGDTPGVDKAPLLILTATRSGFGKVTTYARFGCVQFEERKDA